MKKSELAKAIKSVLAEGMPNLKKPTKWETQNDTPEMTKVRKKLHAIQDRQDKFDKDKKDGKWTTEKGRPIQDKIIDDKMAIFAELNKLRKEADAKKKKEKLDESAVRQAVKEVLAEEGQETVKLTADNIKYPFVDNTKNAILDKEYCDKVGIKYSLGDSFNVDGTEFQVRSIIEPYFYVLTKLGSGERSMNEEEGQNITLALSVGEASAILDALASSNLENNISKAGDMQGAGGQILANLNRAKAKLHNALNGEQGEDLNEEEYDIVRDIHSVLGRNASQDEVEEYLGRSLSSSELKALGFNSGRVTGYKHGQPQYAGQGQRKTYGRRY
jgi:hypothetical protein